MRRLAVEKRKRDEGGRLSRRNRPRRTLGLHVDPAPEEATEAFVCAFHPTWKFGVQVSVKYSTFCSLPKPPEGLFDDMTSEVQDAWRVVYYFEHRLNRSEPAHRCLYFLHRHAAGARCLALPPFLYTGALPAQPQAVLRLACAGGHLEFARFWHKCFPADPSELKAAVCASSEAGHLSVVAWLYSLLDSMPVDALQSALTTCQLHVLKWISERPGFRGDAKRWTLPPPAVFTDIEDEYVEDFVEWAYKHLVLPFEGHCVLLRVTFEKGLFVSVSNVISWVSFPRAKQHFLTGFKAAFRAHHYDFLLEVWKLLCPAAQHELHKFVFSQTWEVCSSMVQDKIRLLYYLNVRLEDDERNNLLLTAIKKGLIGPVKLLYVSNKAKLTAPAWTNLRRLAVGSGNVRVAQWLVTCQGPLVPAGWWSEAFSLTRSLDMEQWIFHQARERRVPALRWDCRAHFRYHCQAGDYEAVDWIVQTFDHTNACPTQTWIGIAFVKFCHDNQLEAARWWAENYNVVDLFKDDEASFFLQVAVHHLDQGYERSDVVDWALKVFPFLERTYQKVVTDPAARARYRI